MSDWFTAALNTYPRIALAGGPATGKSTLSERVADRPVIHADDFIPLGWSECSAKVAALVNAQPGAVLVEGVQIPRALRKGMRVDAVIWLDQRLSPYNRHHLAMTTGMMTVFTEWRHANPNIPVLLPAPVPVKRALPTKVFT